jgi:hypothetical protein
VTTVAAERGLPRSPALALPAPLYAAFGAGTFLLHYLCAGAYGYQRDELYFLACARHLAWGYVDQPPLIAFIAAFSTWLFGESLHAIRLLPALASAAVVLLTGVLARHFGANRYGQAIAMAAVVVAPIFLYAGTIMTMNAFEPLFWIGSAWYFVRIVDASGKRSTDWAGLAACIALGILNKYTMGAFALAMLAGVALSPQRRLLLSWRALAASGAVLLLIAPNIAWQLSHGWPQIEVLRSAVAGKNPPLSAAEFFFQQTLLANPATLPMWLAGLWFLWRATAYRAFSIAYLLLFAGYVLVHGKVYYFASLYPVLFAAGAVPLARRLQTPLPRAAYACALALTGIVIAPQVLPILPLPAFVRYQNVLDFRHIPEEQRAPGRVPQQFADMLGWDTLAAQVANVYAAVPADVRGRTAILTRNYGMAGAIDHYGKRYGLPGAISGHNNYFLWGPGAYTGESVIAVGIPEDLLHGEFVVVQLAGVFHDPWILPRENDVPIYRCSEPRAPLATFWPRLRDYE